MKSLDCRQSEVIYELCQNIMYLRNPLFDSEPDMKILFICFVRLEATIAVAYIINEHTTNDTLKQMFYWNILLTSKQRFPVDYIIHILN
jgi:hypothetical protein